MSIDISTDAQYQEGVWQAKIIKDNIEKTTYKTIENAINVKTALIKNFELEFGFSRDMKNPDPNYAFNLGILETLKPQ
tara:strand:- start:1141 stop:1374 length:234 start_codon:yes stop_codon:yes gene_type:complete